MADAMKHPRDLTTVTCILGPLATIVVGCRMFSRTYLMRRTGPDDHLIVFALVNAIVCSALAEVAVHHGLGLHFDTISTERDRILAAKYTILAPNFMCVSTTAGKLSVALFLLRVMGQTATKVHRWFLYVLSFISIVVNVLCIIAVIGICIPPESIWNPHVPGRCMGLMTQFAMVMLHGAYNAFTDFVLAIFPIFIFWSVRLPLKLKLTIILVMGAGILASAATTVKCFLLQRLPDQNDITWSWAPITLWYTIEMYVITICASLPTLRPALLWLQKQPYNDSSKNNSSTGYHSSKQRTLRFKSIQLPSLSLKSRKHGNNITGHSRSRNDYDNLSSYSHGSTAPIHVHGGPNPFDLEEGKGNGMKIQKTTEVTVIKD